MMHDKLTTLAITRFNTEQNPNGQFPLKIPGPISQAKLKPKKKNLPPKKNKN
jgi:hypothetical protein